jgi:hypothetical protein
MEAMYVPLECGYIHKTAQHYIPEDGTLHKAENLYSVFSQGGNREESVEPEQHFSRITALTADSRMSH